MEEHILKAQADYWNQAFFKDVAPVTQSHWLDAITYQLSIHLAGSVLEVGCGRGYDTRYQLSSVKPT